VIGLIITGGSLRHYLVPETQIKPIIHYMHGVIIPKYVYAIDTDFNTDGTVNDEIELRLQTLLDDTISISETYKEVWNKQDDMFGFYRTRLWKSNFFTILSARIVISNPDVCKRF